jgi:hypothetical protein
VKNTNKSLVGHKVTLSCRKIRIRKKDDFRMSQRRKCKLSDSSKQDKVDLREYKVIIIETIETTVQGKHPQVYEDYFSTDPLTQSEAVLVGRALAKIPELKGYGKTITIFRLFDGKMYESEEAEMPIQKKVKKQNKHSKQKGGRMA